MRRGSCGTRTVTFDRAALRVDDGRHAIDGAGEDDARHRLREDARRLPGADAAELALGDVDADDEAVEIDDLEQRLVHRHRVAGLDPAHRHGAGDGGANLGVAPGLPRAGERDLQLLEVVLGLSECLFADQLLLEEPFLAREVGPGLGELPLRARHVMPLLVVLQLGEHLAATDVLPLLGEQLHHPPQRRALGVHGDGLLRLEVGRVAEHRLHRPTAEGRDLDGRGLWSGGLLFPVAGLRLGLLLALAVGGVRGVAAAAGEAAGSYQDEGAERRRRPVLDAVNCHG